MPVSEEDARIARINLRHMSWAPAGLDDPDGLMAFAPDGRALWCEEGRGFSLGDISADGLVNVVAEYYGHRPATRLDRGLAASLLIADSYAYQQRHGAGGPGESAQPSPTLDGDVGVMVSTPASLVWVFGQLIASTFLASTPLKRLWNAMAGWVLLVTVFAGAASFLWLSILGEWKPLLLGIAASAAVAGLLGTLSELPAIGLGLVAAFLRDKGWLIVSFSLWLLGLFYTSALMTTWCLGVFVLTVPFVNAANVLPLLIWSAAVAAGPWSYMGAWQLRHGDPPEFSGLVPVAVLQFGYIASLVIAYKWGISFAGAGAALGLAMLGACTIDAALRAPGFLRAADGRLGP